MQRTSVEAPVAFDEFIDAAKRATWVREKGLTVFSLYSPEHLATEVDVFVQSPFDFADAYARAVRIEVAPGVAATFVSLDARMTSDAEDTIWERGWDGHHRTQRRRLARLSLGEKLRWLEEAQQIVWRLSQERDGSRAAPDERPFDLTSRPSPPL